MSITVQWSSVLSSPWHSTSSYFTILSHPLSRCGPDSSPALRFRACSCAHTCVCVARLPGRTPFNNTRCVLARIMRFRCRVPFRTCVRAGVRAPGVFASVCDRRVLRALVALYGRRRRPDGSRNIVTVFVSVSVVVVAVVVS